MEKWNEYTQSASKLIINLIKLNINTMNYWINDFSGVLGAKNSVEFFIAQAKLIHDANIHAIRYILEVNHILTEAFTHPNKILADSLQGTTKKNCLRNVNVGVVEA
jgi:hypothetical protein